jgi:hypothetical protein
LRAPSRPDLRFGFFSMKDWQLRGDHSGVIFR